MSTSPLTPPTATVKQRTVLVVDDNPTNLGVISQHLQDYGYRVLTARSGADGLNRAELATPNLILLDVMMPGLDGFETCRRLKANPTTQHIPVIFMTALTDTSHKVTGFAVGAVDYVTKPIQQEEVMARVETHLRLRELTAELEQKVAERTADLDNAYHLLERLDQAKADFIQVMSHELRTPMSLIAGFTELLQDMPAITEDSEAQELIDGILHGTAWMQDTINHIFDAVQIENGMVDVYFEQVSLPAVLAQVHETVNPALEERHQTLTTGQMESLPPISGDAKLLYKAFRHLLINAIKYTPDHGEIYITGAYTPPDITIAIKDTGIGIAPPDLDLIFEKFYQTGPIALYSSGKTAFKGGGPGLGLSIARSVATIHHGQIWAESTGYDEITLPGSTFFVRLPVEQPKA